MFNSKKTVTIEMTDETKETLGKLDNDIEALVALVDELVTAHTKILSAVQGEIVLLVSEAAGEGVRVFDSDDTTPAEEQQARTTVMPKVPDAMNQQRVFEGGTDENGENRVRATPFTRAPRSVQVEWLKEVMSDGNWTAPIVIAREVANDERHYRYLKHALAGRLREMHEDGIADRRSSHIKGSMFEYRLKRPDA